MKIAIIDSSLFTIPYDRELCNALAKKGNTVHLYGCPLREGETLAMDEPHFHPFFYRFIHIVNGFPNVIRLFLKGLNHIYSMLCLIFELARLKPDVIHFQWCPLPMVDRWFLPRFRKIAPLILTVHDTTPFNDDPASGLQRIGTERILTLFDRLIVHTHRGISRLRSVSIPEDRITVVPHGILSHDSPTDFANSEATVESSNVAGDVVFLQFGKIKPYKGIDLLIRAAAKMPDDVRNRCRFLIVGKAYMDVLQLHEMGEQMGVGERFTFDLRFIDDHEIAGLFHRADVLLFPYREIEASGVLMASLAAGRPIVATRIGVFDELLENQRSTMGNGHH